MGGLQKTIQLEDDDRYKTAENYIDLLFNIFPYPASFSISEIIDKTDFAQTKKNKINGYYYEIKELLTKRFFYAENHHQFGSDIFLTQKGLEAKNAGGHFAYLKNKNEQNNLGFIHITNQTNNYSHMGDNFNGISNSTIYNRSTFNDAFNTVKSKYSKEVAEALNEVKQYIEKSGSKDAGELLDSFNEEILKEKPKTSVLKSLWEGMTKLVPFLIQTANLAEKIFPLFN